MATYKRGSRFYGSQTGMFNGSKVVYPRYINYANVPYVGTYTIDSSTEFRPDLISLAVFKRPDLGWFIMAKNNISGVDELYVGRQLGIPQSNGII